MRRVAEALNKEERPQIRQRHTFEYTRLLTERGPKSALTLTEKRRMTGRVFVFLYRVVEASLRLEHCTMTATATILVTFAYTRTLAERGCKSALILTGNLAVMLQA
jgi:hypothetical protein